MEARRCKPVALWATALGLGVLLLAGILSRAWLLETWYLRQLERGSEEEKLEAIGKLGEWGSERALVRLTECHLSTYPAFLVILRTSVIRRSSQPGVPPFLLYSHGEPLPSPRDHEKLSACGQSINKVRDRIGLNRARAEACAALSDRSLELRARVYFAQVVMLGTTRPGDLPERLVQAMSAEFESLAESDGPEKRMLLEARPEAIKVLLDGLRADDVFTRVGSAFGLGLCGPEASSAVPALKSMLQDPAQELREAAAEALQRISGQAPKDA